MSINDLEYWADLEERFAAKGIRYPRPDVLHPEHQQWLERKLPLYGDPPEKEDASQALEKPVGRKRDTKLGSESKATRSRDKQLPRRKTQGTP